MTHICSQEDLDRALGRALVARAKLLPEEHDEALTEQMIAGGSLSLNLWELGLAHVDDLSETGAELLGLPGLRYARGRDARPPALDRLDLEFVRRAGLLPFALDERQLCVATAQPWKLDVLDEAAARAGLRIVPWFMCDVAVQRLLHRHLGLSPPPRYRGQPMPRTRVREEKRAPDLADETLPELTSEAEFLRLYAGDWAPLPDEKKAAPAKGALAGRLPGAREERSSDEGTLTPPLPMARRTPASLGDEDGVVVADEAGDGFSPPPVPALAPIASAALAIAELERATDRAELGRVLVRFGLSFAPRVALFTCTRGAWIGWTGAGAGLDPRRVAGLMVPVVEGTAFGLVHQGGAPLLGPLAPHPVHRAFCAAVGTRQGSVVGLFPVHHRGRVLFVLYLDAGSRPMAQVGEVLILAQRVPATLERIVARSQSRGIDPARP